MSLRGNIVDLIDLRVRRRERRDPPIGEDQAGRERRLEQRAEEGLVLLISSEQEKQVKFERWAQRAKIRAEILC